jgi:anti-sigma-K factor RskA
LGILNRVDEGDRIELLLPLALQTGTDTLAISLEETGGSKSDGPEGPVLYTGAVSTL